MNNFIEAKPSQRTGHIAVSYEKYMFVWGGYKEHRAAIPNTYFSGSEIWMYSCETGKWYLKKTFPSEYPPGMSGSAAVVIDDALYLFGGYGYSSEGCTNNLYKLDLLTFNWELLTPTGIPPIPVDKMVGWQYNKKFYVFGGFGNPERGSANDFQFVFYHLLWRGWTNQFFEYDPNKNHWKMPICMGPLPSARAAHAAAVIQNKVYIFGGRHDMYRLNDLHCLDMSKLQWSGEITINSPTPEGRSWHSLTSVSDRFLILYGGFSQTNVPLSDCWMFDIVSETWQPIELPFHKPRLWHCACLSIYDEVLIYGGCTSNILDTFRIPEQASDVIIINISPKSLFRLCIDRLLELPSLRFLWDCLPSNIHSLLQLKLGVLLQNTSSSVDGS